MRSRQRPDRYLRVNKRVDDKSIHFCRELDDAVEPAPILDVAEHLRADLHAPGLLGRLLPFVLAVPVDDDVLELRHAAGEGMRRREPRAVRDYVNVLDGPPAELLGLGGHRREEARRAGAPQRLLADAREHLGL
jgi:hypothetical protein